MSEYITWEEHKSMIQHTYTPLITPLIERTKILCPKCNKPLRKDGSIVFTTHPAQYRYFCEDCGWQGMGW